MKYKRVQETKLSVTFFILRYISLSLKFFSLFRKLLGFVIKRSKFFIWKYNKRNIQKRSAENNKSGIPALESKQ